MKIQAVIFDWAGTTVDYGSFAPVQAFIDTFLDMGIHVTLEEVREPMGMLKRNHIEAMLSMKRINNIFLLKYNREPNKHDVDLLLEKFTDRLMEKLTEETKLKPLVIETFNQLKDRGIKVGSTTGYTASMLLPVAIRASELGYKPDAIFTPDDVNGLGRPHPEMIFKNLSALGISKRECVIKVGDTISDIKEAKNAGVQAFGVLEGSSVIGLSEEEWNDLSDDQKEQCKLKATKVYLDAGADEVLTNIGELLHYI